MLTIVGSALAQPQDTAPPPPQPVYEIRVEGQKEPIYGFVSEEDWKKSLARVTLDMPWASEPDVRNVNPDKASRQKERPRSRQRRLERQALAAGFERLGDKYYPIKEIQWAQRARDMAGIRDHTPVEGAVDVPDAVESAPAVPTTPSQSPVPTPGLIQRWWMHVGLVIVALVLVGLIAKTMLFSGGA